MHSEFLPKPPPTAPARDRLLHAAFCVFSRDGLHAATTRHIAEEAGVNEVTLFRLFGTKDGLLAALMSFLVEIGLSRSQPEGDNKEWTGKTSLRENFRRFAQGYYSLLVEGEAFIRMMVGEAHRYPEHARKVIDDAGKPLRQRFVANLEAAREAGKVQPGADLNVVAEVFLDALFSGMLRHTAGFCGESTPEQFLDTCADIFAAGLAVPKRQRVRVG